MPRGCESRRNLLLLGAAFLLSSSFLQCFAQTSTSGPVQTPPPSPAQTTIPSPAQTATSGPAIIPIESDKPLWGSLVAGQTSCYQFSLDATGISPCTPCNLSGSDVAYRDSSDARSRILACCQDLCAVRTVHGPPASPRFCARLPFRWPRRQLGVSKRKVHRSGHLNPICMHESHFPERALPTSLFPR